MVRAIPAGRLMDGTDPASGSDGLAVEFEKLRPELLRFLTARSGEGVLAHDLLQDLWLRTVDRPTGPVANARAYLFRAANNLVLDYRRSERRTMVRERAWIEQDGRVGDQGDAPDPALRVDEALVQQQEIGRLKAAVSQLPPGAQQALRLYRFDGLSQPEIAERMGISRSGVEKHLALAMRHLRLALVDQDQPVHPAGHHFLGPRGIGQQQDSSNDRG